MGEIARFVPRAEFTCKLNLEAYCKFNRLQLPSSIGPWESDIWDVSVTQKRRKEKYGKRIYFRTWQASKGNSTQSLGEPLAESFKSFAKAYLAEILRERKTSEMGRTLKAVQCLAAATEALRTPACISKVDNEVADYAAQLIADRIAFTNRWNHGRELQRLIDRIKEAGLTEWKGDWKQPFKYQKPLRNDEVNKRGKRSESYKDRLPDVRAILALADIHHTATDDNDKISTSFGSLAMLAPERASEILTMPVNCKTSMSKNGTEVFGVMWTPLKGGQAKTNWAIGGEFAQVANSTIDFLIKRGEKARAAARWYEENPDKLYLPPGLEHLREERGITLWEASQIVGRNTTPKPCHKKKCFGFTVDVGLIQGTDMEGRIEKKTNLKRRAAFVKLYSFDELEKHILESLPRSFPIVDAASQLHFSEALWCQPYNILRADGDTLEYVPDVISLNMINHQLGANPRQVTVFSRHNKLDDNGEPWKITSHQFRHFLNTLGQSKSLSQELIAFWSGRKRVEQNEWYDHIPQEAYIEAYLKLQSSVPELAVTGPLEDKIQSTSLEHQLNRRDALSYELGSMHITRYGLCRHDYALTPCPKDKDCINCGEHVFVKGNADQIREAEEQVALITKGLRLAEDALAEGRYGAQRWVDLNKPKLDRWELAMSLLTDPEIPDGTLISMPKPTVSQCKTGIAQAIRSDNEEENNIDTQLVRMMLE